MRTLAAALYVLTATAARADAPKPIASYKVDSSAFIDDPFALRDDGKALAYLSTDGASASQLHLAEVPAGAKPEAVIPGLAVNTVALYWLGPDRVLAVARDADKQIATGQVYTSKGPTKEKLGPVEEIALGTIDGKPAVVTYTRREKGPVEILLAAYARDTMKPLAKKSYKEDADGRIAAPGGPYKVLWWRDGFTAAAALKAGEFDKAKDMRRPDRFARLDVFKGKITEEREIEDVLGFAQVGIEHKKHPNEKSFVHLSEDHKKLLLADQLEDRELTLARPLFMYDNTTLGYQLLDDGRMAVSATVDPTNPPALQRKKVDPDDFDLYLVDPKSLAATRVLQLAGENRPTVWRIAAARLALLRKSKGFDRGGVVIEVYDLH